MEDPIVEICDGKVRGLISKNHDGDNFFSFLGIPYGKPPLGELRFKAPLPAEPWSGIKDAVKDGDPCYQKYLVINSTVGSEDCLYLNVFTRNISGNQILKPVLFYIHGGGFVMGCGDSDMFSPIFLMTEDIVVVTFNYRVGALGFLSLNDASLEVPGNAGLKDQLLALIWVQNNIKKFGGDANNVTICGTSAGSVSANYHVLSPASKGLFHKAILHSGTVFSPFSKMAQPKSLGIVKYLKLHYANEAELLTALRKVPVDELVDAQLKLDDELDDSATPPFAPTIEKPNDTAFITRKTTDIITSGDYSEVPILISYTSNEGLCLEMKPDEAKKIHTELYIPGIVLPDEKVKKEEILEELRRLYTNEQYKNNKYRAAGDSLFTMGILGLTKNLSKTSTKPIYLYKFDVIASRNKLRKVMKIGNDIPGASHADDLGYIFESSMFKDNPIVPGTIEDITMRRNIKIWANFMKYGNPVSDQEDFKNLLWQPVTKDTLHYLYFGKELSVGIDPEGDRVEVWRKVFKSHEDTKDYMP